jgi:hypothetical protein
MRWGMREDGEKGSGEDRRGGVEKERWQRTGRVEAEGLDTRRARL